MDRERWQRLGAVFDRCLELPLTERAGFLDEACGGDSELRAEVEALLAADEAEASRFLELPAAERAAPFLEETFEDPEAEAPPPESIGPYRVLEPLGQGGMGEVYRGYDARLRRPVALKRVRLSAGEGEPARRRFQREARAMARLSHSAVVQVYDWVEAEGEEWIVMELVDGRPLRELLAQGPLSPAEAVRIGRAVAAGLAAAHAAGVVHRDLKLDNVMATSSGEVKILDFGIARPLRDEEGEGPSHSNLTVAGMVVGTVIAMSPEQALGQRVDHRSDLFSLGSLLYELLTGESPFRGGNAMETLSRICSLKQVPVIRLRPEVPPAFSALVDHLLEKGPARRPANAMEVVAALDGIAAGLPSGARRRKWGAAAAVAIAVCLLALQPGPPAAAPPPPAPASAYEHYQQGMAALERYYRPGGIDAAIASFRQASALDAGYAPAYAGLALAYWRKSRREKDTAWLEQARGNASRALELDSQLTAARVSLALIDLAQGEQEAAKREIDEVLALDPANPDAHRALADYRAAAGDPAAAEAAYRKAIGLRPGDLDLHGSLGTLYYSLGRYDDAEAAFTRARALDSADYSSHKNLAAVYHMQGRYAEAARSLQKALEIRPDPRTYNNLGTLYFFQGLYPQAVAALEKAVELGANDYQAWGNLGDAYRWTPGDEEKAGEAYRTAIHLLMREIEQAAESPVLRARLANYRAKRGDREEALRELRQLEGREGKDGAACFNATQAAEIAGARDLALAFLRQALAAGYSLEEIRKDPELSGLRKDARFHRLVAEAEESAP